MRKILLFVLLLPLPAFCATDVAVVPLPGPAGTTKISPPNGSAIAYRMDYPSQKTITFQNVADIEVYIGTFSSVSTTTGFPLLTKGSSISLDLSNGTTIYFYGNGASADIRAIFAR